MAKVERLITGNFFIKPERFADLAAADKKGVGIGIFTPRRPASFAEAQEGAATINQAVAEMSPEEVAQTNQKIEQQLKKAFPHAFKSES